MKINILLMTFCLIISGFCLSHPVIYKGGLIYQGSFMPKMNELKVGYSFDPELAVMAKSQSFELNNNYRDYTLGINYLAKRWLSFDSQANLYLGAFSGTYKDDLGSGQTSHAMLMGDWEDREDYVLFKSKLYYYDNESSQDYMARYGFAPFVAGMDELQTWMILQAYYYDKQSKEVILTPMIRFFYKNVLWELGSSTKGDSFLTLMVHY